MTCYVKQCKNVRRLLPPESKISFHRFPTDEEAFRIWLHALDKPDENFTWSRTKFICSDHFKPEDFETVAQKRILKSTAIPALHIHQDEKNQGDNIVWAGTSTSSHSTTVCDKSLAFLEPMWYPSTSPRKKRKHDVLSDESSSESSPLPSPAIHSSGVIIESAGSDSSASRKSKQVS